MMLDFFSQLPDVTKHFLMIAAVTACAVLTVALVFYFMKHKIDRSVAQLKKLDRQIEKHKIDTLITGMITRSDIHFWIKNTMKSSHHCILMTGEVAREMDHDLDLPSAGGGQVLYLCVYQPGNQKVIRRRFIVADSVEPELESLIKENNGSVDFEY